MAAREASVARKTLETDIHLTLALDGTGACQISTGIPFFDHMLTLTAVHGFFDLTLQAVGDLAVDFHHTVEDVGLALGDAFAQALGSRQGIRRYGHAVTPMDEALCAVTVDLSNRPFLAWHMPPAVGGGTPFDASLAQEFFRALTQRGGMTLHLDVRAGENAHHILEATFKATGRALDQAVGLDPRVRTVRSSKGAL